MATVNLAASIKTSVLNTIQAAIDAGATGGLIKIYSGVIPATPETAVTTQTLLGTLVFSVTSGSIASQIFTAAAITPDASADATGTASWARITDSDGNPVIDCDVSTTSGSGAIKLNTTSIVERGPISLTGFTIHF